MKNTGKVKKENIIGFQQCFYLGAPGRKNARFRKEYCLSKTNKFILYITHPIISQVTK